VDRRIVACAVLILALMPTVGEAQDGHGQGAAEWVSTVLPQPSGDARVVGVAAGPSLVPGRPELFGVYGAPETVAWEEAWAATEANLATLIARVRESGAEATIVEELLAYNENRFDAARARSRDELVLQRLSLAAHFAEAAGKHQRERDARAAALLDRTRDVLRRQRDQRDIARPGHGGEVGVAGESLDVTVLRVDGVDLPRIAEIGEQPQRLSPDAAGILRDTDYRDAARMRCRSRLARTSPPRTGSPPQRRLQIRQ